MSIYSLYAPRHTPSKRGRPREDRITTSLYYAYCTGLSIEEVAQQFGKTTKSVTDRFKRMHLPLRPRGFKCECRGRNPRPVTGVPFELANLRRTQMAAHVHMKQYEAALKVATNSRMRDVLSLRISNPEASVAEIGEMFVPPMSKDSVYGLLRRALVAVSS